MGDESKAITGLPADGSFPSGEFVELIMSRCQECPKHGTWTQTIRDGDGRITQYDMWDVHHANQTGHKKFHQFKLTRSNARIM